MKNMKKLKIAILSISLITVMAGAAASPALGSMQKYFSEVNPLLIKLIITLPSLFIVLTSFSFTFISSKLSSKVTAIIGVILYISGGIGAGFVSNIYLILFMRSLLGVGVGLLMPLSTGLLSYYFDRGEQAKLMGYSSAMNNLGGVIASVIAGFLANINWRYTFIVYCLGFIVLLLVILFLPNEIPEKQNKIKLTFKDIKSIVPYMVVIFMVMFVFYVFPSNFSMIAIQTGKIPMTLVGVVMSVQTLAAFFIGIFLSKLLKKWKEKSKYIATSSLTIGFFLLSFISNITLTIIGLFFIGIGMGIVVPLLNSQIPLKIQREKVPAAMSYMSIFLFLGQFASPIILDLIKSVLGINSLNSPYQITSVIALIVTIGMVFVPIKYIND